MRVNDEDLATMRRQIADCSQQGSTWVYVEQIANVLDDLHDCRAELEGLTDTMGMLLVESRLREAEIARISAGLERVKVALHEAICRPMGVVPDSALEWYDPNHAALDGGEE